MPSIVKIIIFFTAWAGLWLPVAIPTAIALKWRPPQPLGNKKLPLLGSLYLMVPLIFWGVTKIEGVSLYTLGLRGELKTLASLGIGWSIGVLSLAILFGSEWIFGWIQWQTAEARKDNNTNLFGSIALNFLLGLWVSATEELIFRGFLLWELQQDYTLVMAAAIASMIFAIAHLIWEVKETLPQLPGLWLMGMVLALARTCDGGNLGLAIGLHAGWIWAIASLDTTQLISYSEQAPQWFVGTVGKPLAGASGLLLLLATAGIIKLMTVN